MISALIFIAACAVFTGAEARIHRDSTVRHAFVKQQACPSTGRHRLPCPGWQIDHVQPLKCHGADATWNLQWLTIENHKAKTRREAKLCRTATYIHKKPLRLLRKAKSPQMRAFLLLCRYRWGWIFWFWRSAKHALENILFTNTSAAICHIQSPRKDYQTKILRHY